MFRRRRRNPITSFLIGGIVGSAAALAFAPASGRETRNNISAGANNILNKAIEQKNILVRDARRAAEGIVQKSENILRKSIDFAEGKYTSSLGGIDLEIRSIRNAIQAASSAYTSTKSQIPGTRPAAESAPFGNEVIVNEMLTDFEDETLPKNEGMGRRH